MQRLTAEWVGGGLSFVISLTLAASMTWVYYVDIQSYSEPVILGEVFPKLIGPYLVPGYLIALNFLCIPMIYWRDKRKAVALSEHSQSIANVADIMTPSPWRKTPDNIEDASAEDSSSARPRDFRVPENALHILTALGGGLGAFLSQQLFRHKTSKQSFRTFFYFTLIVNAPVLYYLWQTHTKWSTGA